MTTMTSQEAARHFSELLRQVAEGTEVLITEGGRPIAVMMPAGEEAPLTIEEAIAQLGQFRCGSRVEGSALRNFIEEGRD